MNQAQILDIYLVAVQFRKCYDPRPCVIIQLTSRRIAALACVSAAMALRRPGFDFLISEDHPDFAATGLHRTSYVSGDNIVDVSESKLTEPMGRLEGDLARDFRKWIGI